MSELLGSKTEENLKTAFAGESQGNRRYVYFAQRADADGNYEVSSIFRAAADGETWHALGLLEFLEVTGDPTTGQPLGTIMHNLQAALAGETRDCTVTYPAMAKIARDEGFDEIAQWFETIVKEKKAFVARFQKAVNDLAKSGA